MVHTVLPGFGRPPGRTPTRRGQDCRVGAAPSKAAEGARQHESLPSASPPRGKDLRKFRETSAFTRPTAPPNEYVQAAAGLFACARKAGAEGGVGLGGREGRHAVHNRTDQGAGLPGCGVAAKLRHVDILRSTSTPNLMIACQRLIGMGGRRRGRPGDAIRAAWSWMRGTRRPTPQITRLLGSSPLARALLVADACVRTDGFRGSFSRS